MTLTQNFSPTRAEGFFNLDPSIPKVGFGNAARYSPQNNAKGIAQGSGRSTWASLGGPQGANVWFTFEGITTPTNYTFINYKLVVNGEYIAFKDNTTDDDPNHLPDSPCVDQLLIIRQELSGGEDTDTIVPYATDLPVGLTANKVEGPAASANYKTLESVTRGTFNIHLRSELIGDCIRDEVKIYEVYIVAEFTEFGKSSVTQGSLTGELNTLPYQDFYPTAVGGTYIAVGGAAPWILNDHWDGSYIYIQPNLSEVASFTIPYNDLAGKLLYKWEIHSRVGWATGGATVIEQFANVIDGPNLPQSSWDISGYASATPTDYIGFAVGAEYDMLWAALQGYPYPYNQFLFQANDTNVGQLRLYELFVRCYYASPTTAIPVEPTGQIINPQPSALIAVDQPDGLPILESQTVYVQEAIYGQPGFVFNPAQFTQKPYPGVATLTVPDWGDVAYAQVGAMGSIPVDTDDFHWLPTTPAPVFAVPFVQKTGNVGSGSFLYVNRYAGRYGYNGWLPPGKYRCYVVTKIGGPGAVGSSVGPTYEYSPYYTEFEIVPADEVDSDGTLGVEAHEVFIGRTGETVGQVLLPNAGSDFTRVIDDASSGTFTVAVQDCNESLRVLFGEVETWEIEVLVRRAGETVWSGPVLDMAVNDGFVELTCKDRGFWMAKRTPQYSQRYDLCPGSSIFFALAHDALEQQNPGLILESFGSGGKVSVEVKTGEHKATQDFLGELARSSVDYTVVHDRMWISGGDLHFAELFPIIDGINATVEVSKHGPEKATRLTAIGSGGGPQSLPVLGRAELANSPILLDVAVSEAGLTDGGLAAEVAATRLAYVANDQVELSITLDRSYPVPLSALIPGSPVRVQVDHILKNVDQIGILAEVHVTSTPDGDEQIAVRVDL